MVHDGHIYVIVSRRKAMREASRRVKKKTGAINADIESALSGIRTAKAFANEPVEAEKFTRSNDTYKTPKKQFHKEMGIFMGTMEFFTTSLSVAVVAVGGLLIMQGQMDTVDLLTFTLYIASFVTPIRKLANFSELYANGTAGFERFLEIMRTEPELRDAPDAVDLGRPRGEIGVNDVSFSYEGDLAVLHDVSLQIPAGQTVALPEHFRHDFRGGFRRRFFKLVEGYACLAAREIRDSPDNYERNSVCTGGLSDRGALHLGRRRAEKGDDLPLFLLVGHEYVA